MPPFYLNLEIVFFFFLFIWNFSFTFWNLWYFFPFFFNQLVEGLFSMRSTQSSFVLTHVCVFFQILEPPSLNCFLFIEGWFLLVQEVAAFYSFILIWKSIVEEVCKKKIPITYTIFFYVTSSTKVIKEDGPVKKIPHTGDKASLDRCG